MSSSSALREIFTLGRPLVQQWLEVGEQIAALREVATAKGLDWSQVKALLKAQIQDELDETGEGKRVRRIVEKAEFASAYADMLGLGNMNEKKYSEEPTSPQSTDVVNPVAHAKPEPAESKGGKISASHSEPRATTPQPTQVEGAATAGDAPTQPSVTGSSIPMSPADAPPSAAIAPEPEVTSPAPGSGAPVHGEAFKARAAA